MIRIVKSLEELMKLLGGEEPETHNHAEDDICFCGSKNDAVEASMKLMEQMVANDCPIWAMQIAAACQIIALAISAKIVDGSGAYEAIRINLTETMLAEPNAARLRALLDQIAPMPTH